MALNGVLSSEGSKFVYSHLLCLITNQYISTMADGRTPILDALDELPTAQSLQSLDCLFRLLLLLSHLLPICPACQAAKPASLHVLISNDGVVHVERRQCYPRPPEKTACVVEFTSNVQLPKKNLQSYALHMLKYAPKKARICKKKAEESRKYWFHINI